MLDSSLVLTSFQEDELALYHHLEVTNGLFKYQYELKDLNY